MRILSAVLLLCIAAVVSLTSCNRPRPAKFQPGDRVKVKAGNTEGAVWLRTRFFRDDLYWIRVVGSSWDRLPISVREEYTAMNAAYERYRREIGEEVPPGRPAPPGTEGPFHESELELASK